MQAEKFVISFPVIKTWFCAIQHCFLDFPYLHGIFFVYLRGKLVLRYDNRTYS